MEPKIEEKDFKQLYYKQLLNKKAPASADFGLIGGFLICLSILFIFYLMIVAMELVVWNIVEFLVWLVGKII